MAGLDHLATVICFLLGSSEWISGLQFWHRRGLRQGDPLSPLLFVLAIGPLYRLLSTATECGMLAPLPGRGTSMRISFYADDAIIFANPIKEEVDTLLNLLQGFGDATRLHLNQAKSTVAAIRCEQLPLSDVLQGFGGRTVEFPITYLGLPISTTRLCIVHLQFMLDRIKARLAGWKGRLMSIAGRRVLIRCVLSALPTFSMTVLMLPKKIISEIDKDSSGARTMRYREENAKWLGTKCVLRLRVVA